MSTLSDTVIFFANDLITYTTFYAVSLLRSGRVKGRLQISRWANHLLPIIAVEAPPWIHMSQLVGLVVGEATEARN